MVKEQDEMDVSPDTKFFTMEVGGGAPAAAPAAAAAAAPVAAAAATAASTPGVRETPMKGVAAAMVKAMTQQPGDTVTFSQFDSMDFNKVRAVAKEHGVTPPIVMVKHLGETLKKLDLNKKLNKERKVMLHVLLDFLFNRID